MLVKVTKNQNSIYFYYPLFLLLLPLFFFSLERLNVAFVNPDENSGLLSAEEMTRVKKSHEEHRALLRIPRR